ncbi:MAG: bifunctional diaminohydroxyphosphoribosylaminopyrimidine deaminase/5-amino-6-(5-phosphoribosylamino)uracil reductase RibD [Actinomycetota bacterium]
MDKFDLRMMRRALALAERGRGRTSPNPPVGAVLVRNGSIISEAFHERAGEAHAEVRAIELAGTQAQGATLYLTLEPCTIQGRTPPCAPHVVAAGISRAVIGCSDPNPLVNGAGIAALERAGIEVTRGILELDARKMIEAFSKHIQSGSAFLTGKCALTLDGRAGAADGSSKWITGPTARRDAHRLRSSVDAVMVGVGTIVRDDPLLTVRLRGYKSPQPLRVVLDSAGRIPLDAKVLNRDAPTVVFVTDKAPEDSVAAIEHKGAQVIMAPARDGHIDLESVLKELGARGLTEVLLEGGPGVLGDAVEQSLVDRYVVYLAPKLLGSSGLPAISGFVIPTIGEARELVISSVRHVGADLRIEAYPRPA